MAVPAPSSSPADSSIPALPAEMRKTIPSQDQRWIVSTLFQAGRLWPDLKLWYEPPVPSLIYHQAPSPDRFFTHRMLVWMPYHQWKVRLLCPVCGKQLTGYGIHKELARSLTLTDITSSWQRHSGVLSVEPITCQPARLSWTNWTFHTEDCFASSWHTSKNLNTSHKIIFYSIHTNCSL